MAEDDVVRGAWNGREGGLHAPGAYGGEGVPTGSAHAASSASSARGAAPESGMTRMSNPLESGLGHNAKLGRRKVEQACVQQLHATRRGRVPEDLVDFMNRAEVYFLDSEGHTVPVDHVMIVWKEE